MKERTLKTLALCVTLTLAAAACGDSPTTPAATSLALVKLMINDDGGTAVATAFTLNAAGPTPISGAGGATSGAGFSPGTYALSETGPSGYVASAWACTGGAQAGSSIALAPGETAVCQITNNDVTGNGPAVFINEIHYDNPGTDIDEFIEIAGPAGTDLSNYALELYNGSGGAVYGVQGLAGTIPDQQGGFGTVHFAYPSNGLQNGSPDGMALILGTTVIQFLSYEGTFTATSGTAAGLTSTDIGVAESGLDPAGMSLQLQGTGTNYADFTWAGPLAATAGAVNTGQTFAP